MVEDKIWDIPDLPEHVRERNMKSMLSESEESESDQEEKWLTEVFHAFEQVPADAFLTGKAVKSEVSLKDLSPEDREKFWESMAKEWESWKKFGAVEILTQAHIDALPDDIQIVGTRWVHTDKNSKPRLLATYLSKKTGKSLAQIKKEFPFAAKSRLVVQGCQESNPDEIRSDSPTASLLAFNLVCSVATMQKWIILSCDASTAYLQSQGISRLLILRPPRPPPPGVSLTDLLRAKGSIYGTKDAGRSWWRKLYKTLKKYGWRMSRIEAAMFLLVIDGQLSGLLITHVDDLFCTGTGDVFHQTIADMEKETHLKVQKKEFRFCGKNIKQCDDYTIEIDQYDAIEGIDYMPLEKDRRAMPNAPLNAVEISMFRGLIGQMGWVSRQSRPDLMVNVSLAAQSIGRPTVKDVVNLNKAVKMLKSSADAKWRFVPSDEIQLSSCVVCVFADSSFAYVEGMKSQCGYLIALTVPRIKDGQPAPLHVLETFSGSIKRVCRSTLAAEANGFLTGVEAGEYVRALLLELQHPGEKLRNLDAEYVKRKILCLTDAKSLETTLNRDAGQPTDKRVRILVAQVKELIGENTYEDEESAYAIWCDTSQMLADVLTKLGCEREPLLEALYSGTWQLEASQSAKDKKLVIRAHRHARKQAKKTATEAKDGCENTQL